MNKKAIKEQLKDLEDSLRTDWELLEDMACLEDMLEGEDISDPNDMRCNCTGSDFCVINFLTRKEKK